MSTVEEERPWEQLEELAETSGPEELAAFIGSLPPGDAILAVSRVSGETQAKIMTILPPEEAAEWFEQIPEPQAVELLEILLPSDAAAIVQELPSNEQADFLGELGELNEAAVQAILAEMNPEEAHEIRRLREYPDEVAGGLMVTELLYYPSHFSTAQVIADMRSNADSYRDYQVQYAYAVGPKRKLVGVLRLRDLLLARPDQAIRELMIREPITVLDTTPLDELREMFDRHHFLGVPVVSETGRLLGLVQRTDVEHALGDRSDNDYRKSQGLVREELRSMPLLTRSRRRLAWLSINILLNVIAASVIALYQGTLQQVIALAVFLPIISDMSGCSGGQAVAVSMREISLGLVRPSELLRVWGKEISVGLVNGIALGLLIALVAWAWKGNPYLGLVVGTAMALNTMVAVSIGGMLPLAIKRMDMDPALASGPILTTLTDMCGFFLVLSLAAALLPYLTT